MWDYERCSLLYWPIHMSVGYSTDTRVELRGQRQEQRFQREQTEKRLKPTLTIVPRPVVMQARITQHRG